MTFVYLLMMIFITVDRLLEISLNIKYNLYCNEAKAKWLLIFTWITGLAMTFGIILTTIFTEFEYERPFDLYLHTPLSLTFIILAIVTYVLIFRKFKQTRITPSEYNHSGPSSNQVSNVYTVFRKSKFFVSVLLISSFILFVEIPGFIFFIVAVGMKKRLYYMGACFMISINISHIADVFIYVFFQASVRKLFWKRIRNQNICCVNNTRESRRYSSRNSVGVMPRNFSVHTVHQDRWRKASSQ